MKSEPRTLSHGNAYRDSPKPGDLHLSYLETSPEAPSILWSRLLSAQAGQRVPLGRDAEEQGCWPDLSANCGQKPFLCLIVFLVHSLYRKHCISSDKR